jgi:hypothetical protein
MLVADRHELKKPGWATHPARSLNHTRVVKQRERVTRNPFLVIPLWPVVQVFRAIAHFNNLCGWNVFPSGESSYRGRQRVVGDGAAVVPFEKLIVLVRVNALDCPAPHGSALHLVADKDSGYGRDTGCQHLLMGRFDRPAAEHIPNLLLLRSVVALLAQVLVDDILNLGDWFAALAAKQAERLRVHR